MANSGAVSPQERVVGAGNLILAPAKRPVRSLPPSKPLTGPAPPRRSVCAAGNDVMPLYRRPHLSATTDHVIPQLASAPSIRLGAEPGPTPLRATRLASSRDTSA